MEPHSDQDSGGVESKKGDKQGNGSNTPKKSNKAPPDPTKETKKVEKPHSENELGYTNGCKVDAYKGFSAKQYDEPVILVSYKEPLPSGFEDRHDEIVPIRLIAKSDPQGLINHLVELLSGGRGNVTI
ncbi:unnamed protein product [Haemonchus placei]|uniref:DUF3444 domain-containing protein n=1 Tax=Haemonchus placei TaxID=6290 RepID=A0A0N4WDF5_HAEPC|nr:unnamed protein product [Haemonchus placei]